ncbi:unnamed protein product [Arctia plantaginis]|uniref:Fatty acyl-CoA reductase n=1 Tax=Arctia plantaginis TaxID=874455 RepID=A0A8S1BHU0_ARCPL|nr:unnamed protein product [Arctia plantaginis]
MDPAQEIELSALARQKPMNDVIDIGDSPVQLFYEGATVFVTGGSGFIGKQLIEKLFRSCAIEKLYLLIRPKKSMTIQERLNQMLQNPVYDLLRTKKPEFADKIIPVEGNINEIRLGLSEKDWSMLTDEVNIIFHVAATVRFDEKLRKATLTNIRSTREALELARSCKNLKNYIHISTAFSFATQDRIGKEIFEQFYPCPIPPDTMISLAENVDENKLDNITNNLIQGWPNTYMFTKCISEELVRTKRGDLPVCIVRPPIVLPAYYEPAPGWLDEHTIIGPSGIYLGGGLGVLRLFCADVNSDIAIAPVDYVNNTIIAAAWDSSERRKNGETEIPIYTIAKNVRYGFIGDTSYKEIKRLLSPKIVWRSNMLEVKSRLLYDILSWFLLYIPAYILDFACFVSGKKPQGISSFVDFYGKVNKLSVVYEYFTRNAFTFREDNVKTMMSRMNDVDRAIYNCNLSDVELEDYILVWGTGLRKFILKDGLTGTKFAYRKQQIFVVLDTILMALYAYVLWWICSSGYFFIKYIILLF